MSRNPRLFLGAVLSAFSLSCNVISPPPLLPNLARITPNEPGDMRVMLVVGLGAGVWLDSGVGAELRVESQVNEWATVGGGLSGALNLEHEDADPATAFIPRHNHPRFLYAARTWGRFNPGELDWFALKAGVGIAGTNKGTVALTLDGAPLFGHSFEVGGEAGSVPWHVSPYGGPVVALSVPLRQGDNIMEQKISLGLGPDMHSTSHREPVPFTTTFFVGAQGGLAVDAPGATAWTGALEILSLLAVSDTHAAVLMALATGQGVRVRP
ncbi:MAG TPA: hypothetical protein VM694_33665 [Polyangium sp.]|nr:hypothetical protein [Polyangium sp.]